jgi:hypothetical protein
MPSDRLRQAVALFSAGTRYTAGEASPLTRSRAGARQLIHPAVSDVANPPRLLAIASGFLGPSAVPYRATLFDKSSARNWLVTWHQDIALPLKERRDPRWGVRGR